MTRFEDLFKIPRRFYDDHRWRDLDTPRAWKETKRHVWIDPSDPALLELVSDAEHYAHPYGPDDGPQLATAARALLRAFNSKED